MHIVTTRRDYKGKIYESHLLQHSYREDGKVKHETLANLSHLPLHIIQTVRAQLRGATLVPADDIFTITSSVPHGHVQAVLATFKRLDLDKLLSSTSCRERDLVLAMVAARILCPDSKLATTRTWHASTLAAELGVADATETDLYAAMDWLVDRQPRIEKKLAKRHIQDGDLALYDLSSSYFEGECCPLAVLGYSRDGKRGTLQVNYGLLTDRRGCPVAITVYPGNTTDSTTVLDQVGKLKNDFGLKDIGLVGDRGMITEVQIQAMRGKLDWVTALRTGALRKLADAGFVQLGLFDESNLFAFTHDDFPGERLVACRNPVLGRRRAHKRESMLVATEAELTKVAGMVEKGKLHGQDAIGVRVGKVVNKYKMAKHFSLDIQDDAFSFTRDATTVENEATLDGLYVVRTSLPEAKVSDDEVVRSYKFLTQVERAFRTMKGLDLLVRPIYHRLEERVKSHFFICMLAYYVEWHMKEAWRELLFCDEDQEAKTDRDPVAPAERSATARKKVQSRKLADGTACHSFRTLLQELSTVVRNVCRRKQATEAEPSFTMTTTLNPKQQRAIELLEAMHL